MIELALHVFPLENLSVDFIAEQVFKAVIEKDRDMSLDDCIEYGGDFVLPADEIERNSALFRACNHDFPELIRRSVCHRVRIRQNFLVWGKGKVL
jgi:hypothetical protein